MEYIEKTARLAIAGELAAMITAPINKEATIQAGYGDIGHLEFLARITSAKEYATMLASGQLRVIHLTTHYSLREACDHVTKENILGKLKLTDSSFKRWGFENPRIAVAALNPHGGEGGILGREEIDELSRVGSEESGIDAAGRSRPIPS
jgi:4-hydroxythreonine-4-phosphate dehydrogenase